MPSSTAFSHPPSTREHGAAHLKDHIPPVHDHPEIRFSSVSKRFGSLWANRHITLDVHRGEIHAIVGENGAGKSTLMKILCGHLQPDEGSLAVRGIESRFRSPRQAGETGLGLVSQQPYTFPQLTALENVVVGHPPRLLRLLNSHKTHARVQALCSQFGFELPLDSAAGELAFAHRQQIEILRVLYRDARVLALDEPTSLLAPPEVERLLGLLQSLRASGHTILFVSHRFAEVLSVADRVSILSKGRCLGTYPAAEVTRDLVARLIAEDSDPFAGVQGVSPDPHRPGLSPAGASLALRLEGVRSSPSSDETPLEGVSLSIAEGECFGLGGVVGNGQRSIARLVSGVVQPADGTIHLAGDDVTRMSVKERLRRGLRWLPANLQEEGMIPGAAIVENCLLGRQRDARFQRLGWLCKKAVAAWASSVLATWGVRFEGVSSPARSLSGGNLQRLGLCRALEGDPRVVVLEQPTRGLDLRARDSFRSRILELLQRGVSFLLISHDLDELFELCDRIGILYRGKLMGIQNTAEAQRATLIQWMLGADAPAPPGVEEEG